MSTVKTHKLVRGDVPAILAKHGYTITARRLNDEQYKEALIKKFKEKTARFSETENLRELAELHELFNTIIKAFGYDNDEVKSLAKKTRDSLNDYSGKLYLVSYSEPEDGCDGFIIETKTESLDIDKNINSIVDGWEAANTNPPPKCSIEDLL